MSVLSEWAERVATERHAAGDSEIAHLLRALMAERLPDVPVESRSILTASEESLIDLAIAVEDICFRFTAFGQTDDGDVAKYLVTKGTVHRLVGRAQSAHISAALRAGGVDPPPEPGDDITSLLYRQVGHNHLLISWLEDKIQAVMQENKRLRDEAAS